MGSRASLAREIARPLAAFVNRRRAAGLLVGSTLFDQTWVEHQMGRSFGSREEAVAAYLSAGEPDLSPHPLFQSDWFDPKRTWHEHRYADPLSLYLSRPELRRSRNPHPLFDTGVYLAVQPDSADHPDGPLGHWLATAGDAMPLPTPDGYPFVAWGELRRELYAAVQTERPAESPVTVVLTAGWDPRQTERQIRASLKADPDREVVVVGSIDRSHHALITSLSCAWPSVRYEEARPADLADVVVDIHPDALPLNDAVQLVIDGLGTDAVVAQAVGIDETGVIAAAGVVGGAPFLRGHLEADAVGNHPIDSVDGTLVARRSLADHGAAVLVGDALAITPAEHHFPRTSTGFVTPRPTTGPPPAASQPTSGLRWAIDIAAPADEVGRVWGDYYFAQSLQASLRKQGQHAGIQFRDARQRASLALDDVVLVIRGADVVKPVSGAVNILWIISHPDAITREEVAGFDLVFAASTVWAQRMTAEWGVRIEPLLQCTDPALFHPGLLTHDRRVDGAAAPTLLFLGNSRHEFRPAVRLATEAALDLTVIGSDWDQFLGIGVAQKGVPNAQVGALYANSGVVLNDHWADMRDQGFISNRVFDAVACGARLLTDDVDGLGEVFGNSVAVFTDGASLVEVATRPDLHFPTDAQREVTAARIIAEHSFDARAQTLVEAATRLVSERQSRP